MKTRGYTETPMLAILRQAEGGVPVAQPCRAHRMSRCVVRQISGAGLRYGRLADQQMKATEDKNRPAAAIR